MSVKTKEFSTTGVTVPLEDGKTRPFTLVAIRTAEKIDEPYFHRDSKQIGDELVVTLRSGTVPVNVFTLSLGLALVSPLDQATSTPEQGLAIARGKAQKDKSAYLVLQSPSQYFTEAKVKQILEEEAEKITKNPQKWVKLSAKAAKPTADLGPAHGQAKA